MFCYTGSIFSINSCIYLFIFNRHVLLKDFSKVGERILFLPLPLEITVFSGEEFSANSLWNNDFQWWACSWKRVLYHSRVIWWEGRISDRKKKNKQTSWVKTWDNWTILVLVMKFNLSRSHKHNSLQTCSHKALTVRDRSDFHPVFIR